MTTAAVLLIGNEILSGRTQDANLPYLGRRFDELGITLVEARVVRDVCEEIIQAVNTLRKHYDYVFTTGGIGPTHDDITTECVAQAFGVEVERNPDAVQRLIMAYGEEGLNEARLKMANIPKGAYLIENPVTGAPGFRLGNVFVLAGVPRIMQGMFEGLVPELKGGKPILTLSLSAFTQESRIAQALDALQNEHPAVSVGSYPSRKDQRSVVTVVLRGTDRNELNQMKQRVKAIFTAAGAEPMDDSA